MKMTFLLEIQTLLCAVSNLMPILHVKHIFGARKVLWRGLPSGGGGGGGDVRLFPTKFPLCSLVP